jgi:hypothetical protein
MFKVAKQKKQSRSKQIRDFFSDFMQVGTWSELGKSTHYSCSNIFICVFRCCVPSAQKKWYFCDATVILLIFLETTPI